MTKDCEKIINILNEMHSKNELPCEFMDIIQHFPKNKQGKIALILPDILVKLKNDDYLTYLPGDDTFYHITLTYNGLSYKEVTYSQIKNDLFKSILVPIIVTLLTNLVLDGLKWLLPLLQGLFVNN